MGVEWHFLCADCKIEVDLGRERRFSLLKMNRLDENELQECAESAKRLRGFQKGTGEEGSTLDRLEMVLDLFLEHRNHSTLLYNSSRDVEVEDLPWFERWSWTEDIAALEPTAVAKEGWERGLPLSEAVHLSVTEERKKGKGGIEGEA